MPSSDFAKSPRTSAVPVEPLGQLLAGAAELDREEDLLARILPLLLAASEAEFIGLVQGRFGNWLTLASAGPGRTLPVELLAEALDRDAPMHSPPWTILPLIGGSSKGELLIWHRAAASSTGWITAAATWAKALHDALALVRQRQRQRQRIERLETILKIGVQWIQTPDTDSLLQQVAEASTRFLQAERASIFLWDRPHKLLIARPALGVAGGELRIGDHVGVVGQVVQTGEPRRVDQDEDQRAIDRRVDKQLGFQTRSLLCVPLRDSRGRILGAFEMINKLGGNFSDDDQLALTELATQATLALETTQHVEQLLQLRNRVADQAAAAIKLVGECPAIEALRSTLARIADTDLAVLILGENGTGKEVVAQSLHYLSGRRNHPFVAVNCAAITESLLESELFGHERGAFTDAMEARSGKFELAHGGTLFLDEIGDMSLAGQAKLLRVLEEKIVVRVGGSIPIAVDTRVLAATNQSLVELVRHKRFREDLFYRLNVVTLDIPPLRQRGDDILLLAEHFQQAFCAKARRKPPRFTAAAKKRLLGHAWPGNVRELRNLMERLAWLATGDKLDADDLAFILTPHSEPNSLPDLDLKLPEATRRFQIDFIQRHIDRSCGNITDAARRLGLHRSNLYRKMRQLGMATAEDDSPPGT